MGARDNGVKSEDGIRKRSEEIERENLIVVVRQNLN